MAKIRFSFLYLKSGSSLNRYELNLSNLLKKPNQNKNKKKERKNLEISPILSKAHLLDKWDLFIQHSSLNFQCYQLLNLVKTSYHKFFLLVTYILSHQGCWLSLKSFKETLANAVHLFLRSQRGEEGDFSLLMRKIFYRTIVRKLSNEVK